MKKIKLSIPFFLTATISYSQLSIKGKVIDKQNEALEFATVIAKKNTTTIATATCDSLGYYNLSNLNKGNYLVIFSYVNRAKSELNIQLKQDTIMNITLDGIDSKLKEVILLGKRPLFERKIDRFVYNVGNSITALGEDALDALQKTPGIRVNNENISIVGKNSVAIMLNDKFITLSGNDLTAFLRTIRADNISSIEVLTTPPAKYDAQGNSGLINIRLKSVRKNSFNGSISNTLSQATYFSYGIGNTINYQKNKLTISTGLNIGKGTLKITEAQRIQYPSQYFIQNDYRKSYSEYIRGRFTADYQLNKRTTISGQYLGSYALPRANENSKIQLLDTRYATDSSLMTQAFTVKVNSLNAFNIQFQKKYDTTEKGITAYIDYYQSNNKIQRPFSYTAYDKNGAKIHNNVTGYKNNNCQKVNVFTSSIDFNLPYKTFTMSFGGKLSLIQNFSASAFYSMINSGYQFDDTKSDKFSYAENTTALYVNGQKTLGKWDFQSGMRLEHTQTRGLSETTNKSKSKIYINLFPTLYIVYHYNEENSFSFNYGKRISRPSYKFLNPSKSFSTPYISSIGNPSLEASFDNSVELSYMHSDYLSSAVSLSKESNGYDQITVASSNSNEVTTLVQNFLTKYSVAFTQTYALHPLAIFESRNQLQIYYKKVLSNSSLTNPSFQGLSAYISSDNSFVLNQKKTFQGEINGWYQFPEFDGVDKSGSYFNISLAIKHSFWNNKLQSGIGLSDIFKNDIPKYRSTISNNAQEYYGYYDQQRIKITLTYKFGNSKLRPNARPERNTEEIKRINN